MNQALLSPLLQEWRELLGQWARSGALAQAAQDALGLPTQPEPLRRWVGALGAGAFADLPPVELVPAEALPAAIGAYAPASGTIYLNAEWLQGASRQEALAVLTEELGHHLDAQLNSADTPGDEGELFAALLIGSGAASAERRQALASENDQGTVLVRGRELEAELASRVVSTPIQVARPGRTNREVRNSNAFAALRSDGSVVAWGGSDGFGGSSGVDSQLRSGVIQIFSTFFGFAALKSDGSVVSWSSLGGGGGVVPTSGVTQIFSSPVEFLALKRDGSLISFNPAVPSFVTVRVSSGVRTVCTNNSAGAALKSDGSVVTWGQAFLDGGDSSAVADRLRSGVSQVFSTSLAFAALKSDGSVVTWGDARFGGNSRGVESQLGSGVRSIFANAEAFAALKNDGSVVSWGNLASGGDSSSVASQLRSGVVQIVSTNKAFAALKSDGSVVTWGQAFLDGGDSSAVADRLRSGVSQIFSNDFAFAALKSDGSVVTWGFGGGDSSAVADRLRSGVTQIFSTSFDFAALKIDGSVVTWGSELSGGNSSAVADRLRSGVVQIFSTDRAFAALKSDGSVVTWGRAFLDGGDSRSVAGLLTNVVAFANPFTDDRLVVPPPPPVFSVAPLSASKAEGSGAAATPFTFRVNRSGSTAEASTAVWSVAGQGAVAANGADFSGGAFPTGTVSFAAGETSQTLTVAVAADTTVEANESFKITLSAPSGATLGTASASGTILNDDTALLIAPLAAAKGEGRSGITPFTFTVSRTGVLSGRSTAVWSVAGSGANPTDASDFSGATSGTVSFAAGQTSRTLTLNVRGDRLQETDETFTMSLSASTGATLGSATVAGTIFNDDLIGDAAANTLAGTARAEFLDGGANVDTLTGGGAADLFGFRFGQAPLTAPDVITDFAFGADKIDLFSPTGAALPPPRNFSRAADNASATTLSALAAAVFADANGARAGKQALGANSAVLVRATNAAIAGTYLLINNGVAGRSDSDDLMINLTGFTGPLPALGVIPPGTVFV